MNCLLLTIVLASLPCFAAPQQQGPDHSKQQGQHAVKKGHEAADHVKTYTPDAMQWSAAPNALPTGAQLAVLEGNPMKPGPYTMRLKMPDSYKIPPHHHARREHVTVVSGSFKVGMGDKFEDDKMNTFGPGSFAYLEPAVHHYAKADGETVIQLHGTGPWEIMYVNPQDDPRKQK